MARLVFSAKAKREGYLIFYEYENDQALVNRIIHSKRDYLKILFPEVPDK